MSGRDVNSPVIGSRVTLELCRACVSLGTAELAYIEGDRTAGDLDNDESDRRPDNRDMAALGKERVSRVCWRSDLG